MPAGFDAESLLRSLMENIPGAIYRAVNDEAWTVLTVSRPWVLEYRVVHADGSIRWVHERGVERADRELATRER